MTERIVTILEGPWDLGVPPVTAIVECTHRICHILVFYVNLYIVMIKGTLCFVRFLHLLRLYITCSLLDVEDIANINLPEQVSAILSKRKGQIYYVILIDSLVTSVTCVCYSPQHAHWAVIAQGPRAVVGHLGHGRLHAFPSHLRVAS